MFKISLFNNLFSQKPTKPTEADKIFSFLASISHHPDTIENYLFQYNRLKKKYRNDNDDIFINLYLNWKNLSSTTKQKTIKTTPQKH